MASLPSSAPLRKLAMRWLKEMAAVGASASSSSRKRKASALESTEQALVLVAFAQPNPGAGEDGVRIRSLDDQIQSDIISAEQALALLASALPHPRADEDGSPISRLPDKVLGDIISRLPTNEGARTQILSPRWLHLWRSAPLNFDQFKLGHDHYGKEIAILSHILSSHQGHGRRFFIKTDYANKAAVESSLQSPSMDKLQELDLWFTSPPYVAVVVFHLPASAFRCWKTLRVIQIKACNISDATVQGLHFPELKQLGIVEVTISECSLHSLIAGCPALESLAISGCSGFGCLCINSIRLRRIVFNSYLAGKEQFQKLVIENAPHLKMLLTRGRHVSVIFAPKLETLGIMLVFVSDDIQGPCIDSFTSVVSTVKCLALSMCTLSLDMVIEFLRRFPCLEKLHIRFKTSAEKNKWRSKHRDLIKILDLQLKKIMLCGYFGSKSQVDFATFFVLNARVLESMTLEVFKNNADFLEKQRRKLLLDKRASRGSRFHFTTVRSRELSTIDHVCHLESFDPFESWC